MTGATSLGGGLERRRASPDPVVEADFTAAGGAATTRERSAPRHAPTAIVYANDVMAIAGLSVAHGRG